jgi:hypothetical protein
MANYENGAYEALQWAWIMLKKYRESPNTVEKAIDEIKEKLSHLGEGHKINFREQINL